MEIVKSFKIIGIDIKTTNKENKSIDDLTELWKQFYSKKIQDQISNRHDNYIYSIYTNYETDDTRQYTAIIGCKVDSLENIPKGLRAWEFDGGTYQKFIAKGKMPEAVLKSWKEIWDKDAILNRTYTADFEIYDPKSQQEENATVEIYISVE